MRVFFFEPNDRFNTAPAEKHGEIYYIFDERKLSLDVNQLAESAIGSLQRQNFNPATDHIACSGNIAMLCVVSAAVMDSYGELPLLIFEAKSGEYIPRTLEAFLDPDDADLD